MKNKNILFVFCLIMFFFVGYYLMYRGTHFVDNASSCFLYPFLRLQRSLFEPMQTWCAKRVTLENIRQELQIVRAERDALQAEVIALQGAATYTKETSDLALFNKRYASEKGVIAQVLVRHISDNAQFMLVDIGSRQGIKKDMVALYNNSIIGRVEDVYPWYCKVCLITDATCKVAAHCVKTGSHGIHQGMNKAVTALSHVSHLERIRIGDRVLSSGEGLVFPAGFALGTVSAARQGDLFYTVEVMPAVDFSLLQYCLLVSKEDMR